ncbi:MAG: flippase-like domain-containing protein [Clostridiales bacterium]|nr:flippase-like domain-containing protein [Clostridiales bacterium]
MKVNKQKLKSALNILFIFGTFILVLYFALSQEDLSTVGQTIRKLDPWWMLGGLGCFLVHMTMEGGLLYVFYRFQRVRVSMRQSILCGLIGMYYSSITPAATGGQPMQVYSMKKYGVPAGITSSALAVKFFCWQCALLLLGAVAWIFNGAAIHRALGKGIWMVSLGFFINGIMVVLVILLAISRNAVRAIIIFCVKAAHRLRLVKDVQKTSSRWDAALQDFHASVDIITKHPAQYLSLFALSLIQVTGLMSATYCVYRGFGLNAAGYGEILAIQLMLYIAASFTPLPGASGAQEGGFYLFFGSYFPGSIVFGALLVWRFLTYYLSIITGFIGVLIDGSRNRKRATRLAALQNAEPADGESDDADEQAQPLDAADDEAQPPDQETEP